MGTSVASTPGHLLTRTSIDATNPESVSVECYIRRFSSLGRFLCRHGLHVGVFGTTTCSQKLTGGGSRYESSCSY